MQPYIITLALIVATTLSACNTISGAGEDLQTGGKKLERSADQDKGPDSTNP